ncbi:unnamed protein product [Withania somnifera]
MACFIQAVYLLELDRQENRTEQNALSPKWCIPFKYKLVKTLRDERDGSIFGAILEWDRSAALADFVLIRPSGAPRAVLALRGTILKSPTMRRDIAALKTIADKHGSNNVCIAGHSLGDGFALQVGKSISQRRNIRRGTFMASKSDSQISCEEGGATFFRVGPKQWVPHLYINNSDYICCSYADADGAQNDQAAANKENAKPTNCQVAAKLFLSTKGKQKFLEAHGLEQWWSDNLEIQMAISNSKLIGQQLKSLYTLPAGQLTQVKQ